MEEERDVDRNGQEMGMEQHGIEDKAQLELSLSKLIRELRAAMRAFLAKHWESIGGLPVQPPAHPSPHAILSSGE